MQGVVGWGKFFTVSVGIAGVGWVEIVVVAASKRRGREGMEG